jgi:CubicO group peptidase (beta-lactamase class C family)
MRKLGASFALACALTLGLVLPAAAQPATVGAVAEAAHASGVFDGLILQGENDRIVFQAAYGLRDRARRTPHRLNEPWRWASVTKQFAAVLAMQEMEHGALSLTDTVAARLPDFAAPNAATITVKQLLTHTSGLPNPDDTPLNADGFPTFYMAPAPDLAYCAGPPRAAPGEGFQYNNCDTLVLAAILERATSKPFATLVQERLAKPLHLGGFGLFGANAPPRGFPLAYDTAGALEPHISFASYGASAAMFGDIHDLWALDRALMGGKLLSAASLETLWRGDPALGYVALGAWSYSAKPPGCAAPLRLVERQGAVGNVAVLNLLAPDRHAAIIVFSNTATEWGAVWNNTGLITDLVRAAWCTPSLVPAG